MSTQIEQARRGVITPQCHAVAERERVDPRLLSEHIAQGRAVIMTRERLSIGIGTGLWTKINVNLGTSTVRCNPDDEVKKAQVAELHGADTVSDLSMGGDIPAIRRMIFAHTTLPITTVPVYQTAAQCGIRDMTGDDIIRTIRMQAGEGVSSMVLHTVTVPMLALVKNNPRILGVVSKGGSITGAYMKLHRCENPFIGHFDEILAILKRNDIVLSLGNTLRSGCIHDGRDRAQIAEITQNITLARQAHEAGVQVIIEGVGGHVRMDRIASYVRYHKRRAPFPLFVAGPLPTDVAIGYDHIAGCTGASIASAAGADYLCYITPAEHLGLPTPEHVQEGLVAFRIAAHIGDSVKYGLSHADAALAKCRAALDWEGQLCHALDPVRARDLAPRSGPCTMCGDFCAIKLMREF